MSALHILSDILSTHPGLVSAETANADVRKSVYKIFAKGIKAANTPDVQSAAITALCKLMLTLVVYDEELLRQTVTCYFDPSTGDNPAVTQALSYFLPVFCYSKRENMTLMAAVATDVIHAQVALAEEDEEEEGLIGPVAVGNMLVDWTDARKLVVHDEASVSWDEAGRKEAKTVNGDVYLALAESALERALTHGCTSKSNPYVRVFVLS